jgi:hypothetical protein
MFKQALLPLIAVAALLGSTVAAGAQSPMPSSGMSSAGAEHGMPEGKMGGDGTAYTGDPDLQATVALVVAGGPIGHFSTLKALSALAGPATANAEVAKLTKQYGAAKVNSFVTVQNFAVDDAVKRATAAGVKFPTPTLKGAELAKRLTMLGLQDGTFYVGVMLDHILTHAIHEEVMVDIDQKFGAAADADYHRIADQAHYDLAQALGAKTVKLAAYH